MRAISKKPSLSIIAVLMWVACSTSDPLPASDAGSTTGGVVLGSGGATPGGSNGSGGTTAGSGGSTSGTGGSSGGTSECKPSDCANAPQSAIGCANGSNPTFSCVRGASGTCGWTNPKCPSAPDAAVAGSGGSPGTGGVSGAGGTPASGGSSGSGGAGSGACAVDADCRLFDDYCTGCDCRALSKGDADPKCAGPGVRCFAQPCLNKMPVCENKRCVVKDKSAAATKWFMTCGDPVCGRGWTAKPGVPLCTTQKLGDACTKGGETCDPKNDCNALLICQDKDPKTSPGGCPMSRAVEKRDVRYLDTADLRRYQDQLMGLRLATWRYKATPERERMGFLIDDVRNPQQSVMVDGSGQMVDLYGYASLAVATLKVQAQAIADLQRELAAVKKQMRRR